MRVMAKPSRQRHVRSVLCLPIDLDFAMMPGSVFGLPESIQHLIRSSRKDLSLMSFQGNEKCNLIKYTDHPDKLSNTSRKRGMD